MIRPRLLIGNVHQELNPVMEIICAFVKLTGSLVKARHVLLHVLPTVDKRTVQHANQILLHAWEILKQFVLIKVKARHSNVILDV